ncbi:hypothetical protein QBC40DRAFT_337971 [Triangularia verruculosa]|uniref:Uncharacterized protein n=1 Tax=Triangularia verruculosa TaxID=2587418 RepID=A0AAN6XPD8_9PEZI|nr:hypothetical protein QBC40DRAFT_337971 [Triangularia verruculosa]
MYLPPHTPEILSSPPRTRRSTTAQGSDTHSLNSGQTAALIVFGVLLGLVVTGVMIWCCCCRGPGWQRRSSSRSRVKIIRRSAPRSESGSSESTSTTEVSSVSSPPIFRPLSLPAPLAPIRPLGPRGMLPGALPGLNAGAVMNDSSRRYSVDRQSNPLNIHQQPHQHSQSNTQPVVPPEQYALPSHLQRFAQPPTPNPPQVPIPGATNPAPQLRQSQPPPQPQTRQVVPPYLQPLCVPPPLVYHARHHHAQERVPIAKLINDHAAGVTKPRPLALPLGRHGIVNLALKYQVHSEKGSDTPRVTERGYQSAYCESSADSDEGYDAYESMENFGTTHAMTYGSGRAPRLR